MSETKMKSLRARIKTIHALVDQTDRWLIANHELRALVSMTQSGHFVTVEDLLLDPRVTPEETRKRFRMAAVSVNDPILPVRTLQRDSLRALTIQFLRGTDREAIGDVMRETSRGQEIMDGVLLDSICVELLAATDKLYPSAEFNFKPRPYIL